MLHLCIQVAECVQNKCNAERVQKRCRLGAHNDKEKWRIVQKRSIKIAENVKNSAKKCRMVQKRYRMGAEKVQRRFAQCEHI